VLVELLQRLLIGLVLGEPGRDAVGVDGLGARAPEDEGQKDVVRSSPHVHGRLENSSQRPHAPQVSGLDVGVEPVDARQGGSLGTRRGAQGAAVGELALTKLGQVAQVLIENLLLEALVDDVLPGAPDEQ